jgi:hypothetical protein
MLKTETTGPEGGAVQAEQTVAILPDNGRDPLPGTKGQTAWMHGA